MSYRCPNCLRRFTKGRDMFMKHIKGNKDCKKVYNEKIYKALGRWEI